MLRTVIRKNEVGLRFRRGDFVGVLGPGRYWFQDGMVRPGWRTDVVETTAPRFDHKLIEFMLESDEFRARVEVVDLADDQRAIAWKDGRLQEILGPGRHIFWKSGSELKIETFSVEEVRFKHPRLNAVLECEERSKFLEPVRIQAWEVGMLFRDGVLIERLQPGLHVFWKQAGQLTFRCLDLREQTTDVTGQEIMTADKVTLRVNLVASWRIVDPEAAVNAVADPQQALHRQAQLALREAVGARTLDAMLSEKQDVSREIEEALTPVTRDFGTTVTSVGLRDIILPGDMKLILNQVIQAQKQSEANLIRRREETAAARSQANTARLLAENPALARMKELEALQEIFRDANATFVLGRGDLLDQVQSAALRSDRNA